MPFRHSVFAMELCFAMQPGDALVGQLGGAIEGHPAHATAREKWGLYRGLSELLRGRLPQAVSGCWDFFDEDAKALSDYEMWFQGMATREGARRAPSGVGDAYRGDARYLTFTMALLLHHGAPSERQLGVACQVPQDALWQRATFAHLLKNIPALSFSAVKSDVLYLIPRATDWGLTADDLRSPKFHYLRPLG